MPEIDTSCLSFPAENGHSDFPLADDNTCDAAETPGPRCCLLATLGPQESLVIRNTREEHLGQGPWASSSFSGPWF